MPDEKAEIVFSGYSQAPRLFVNSVWGGALSEDHVVAHFMFKHVTPPESITVDLKTGEQVEQDGVLDINEVQATLIIPPEAALSIGKWLVRHARTMIKERKQTSQETRPEGATVQ